MESFKSISAIDRAIEDIDSKLSEMATNIQSIKDVKDNFDSAWKSQESVVVKSKIDELASNLDALQKGVMNIKIKVNNAKSLAVAADTTVFAGSGDGSSSPRINARNNPNVSYTKQ